MIREMETSSNVVLETLDEMKLSGKLKVGSSPQPSTS